MKRMERISEAILFILFIPVKNMIPNLLDPVGDEYVCVANLV